MALSDYILTFGQYLLERHGERIHKIALDAGFTCPNRDGSKGVGGCTFCNNKSFNPNGREPRTLETQLDSGRSAIAKGTRAKKYLAYFQAYTNTYADVEELDALYRQAMMQHDIVGLSVGTRPDCVSGEVLDLLDGYRREGLIVWLELGLQSAFDETLRRINRGHGLKEYRDVAIEARLRGIPLCTHLILGLPGENEAHYHASLDTVLDIGVDGLKFHALHVVKHTVLANQWRRGEYQPLECGEYIRHVCDLIERTPGHIVFHRVTGTASKDILLAPEWCSQKWRVLNGIEQELKHRGHRQGSLAGTPWLNRHGASATPKHKSASAGRFPHPIPDGTTSHSTKPASGQVAGYLPEGNPHPIPPPEGEGTIALSPASGGKMDRGLGMNVSLCEFRGNENSAQRPTVSGAACALIVNEEILDAA